MTVLNTCIDTYIMIHYKYNLYTEVYCVDCVLDCNGAVGA